jgi:hypothetical protein
MQRIKNGLFLLLFIVIAIPNSFAYISLKDHGKPNANSGAGKAGYREDCAQAKSQIDLNINNVRARLQGGGDIWWDVKDNGLYVIPNVPPGIAPVSSIFAGGIWIGGVDDGGNLKTACTLYRRASDNDWWPGPLDQNGTVTTQTCSNWDKHFVVYGKDIDLFKALYENAPKDATGHVTDPGFIDQIPVSIKGWPSKGNPYFTEVHGFPLPANVKKFAYFWDSNENTTYDPLDGDYPAIFVRFCESSPQYADEMIFWIFNDAGGVHTQSNGQAIRMEVQVQAFAYATNDEINNMSFLAYRLANRASQNIDSMYFAMWTDPDLGCSEDDYIGCDNSLDASGKTRNMMYVYNEDAVDGKPGATCTGGVATYGTKVPILGVDYFRGPVDPNKKEFNPKTGKDEPKELGMSSFMYFNRDVGSPPPATTDPSTVLDFYQYLNSIWKDGTPLSKGGNGYTQNPSAANITKYAFLDAPDDPTGWSMASANLPFGDRRTLQASGPFKLVPGAINELIVGVPWVPDQGGGKVSLAALRRADDKAQGLFDTCFDILDGPDAPDVCPIELDKEIVLVLSNGSAISNNKDELYGLNPNKDKNEKQPESPTTGASPYYVFEGYKIFQLASLEASAADINDPTKAKLVAEVDVKNNVVKQFNWESIDDPNNPSQAATYPVLKVEGTNKGVEHSFRITQDLFAKGQSKSLVNHKKYYYVTIAYAHNNYEKYDKKTGKGQRVTYVEGRKNVSVMTVIPRPIVDRKLNSAYGNGAVITRIDGVGAGGNFLDISDESRAAMIGGSFKGDITYKPGKGPINIKVYNPLSVKDGKFELTFVDPNLSNATLDNPVKWILKNLADNTTIASDVSIDRLNEQVIAKYGFSIGIGQTLDCGKEADNNNGFIGGELAYKNPAGATWFGALPDGGGPIAVAQGGAQFFDFIRNEATEDLNDLDRAQAANTRILDGAFVPYSFCDYRTRTFGTTTPVVIPYTTPAWFNNSNSNYYGKALTATSLSKLRNVDIVMTPDKSKWSRCVVVETANTTYVTAGLETEKSGAFKGNSFDVRAGKTVGSDTDPNAPSDGTNGKSWFPGYAIDVETGERLNIVFGENSAYDPANPTLKDGYKFTQPITSRDMIWNPTTDVFLQGAFPGPPTMVNFYVGGGHYIYVTNQVYDGCKDLYSYAGTSSFNRNFVKTIGWVSMSLANGLLSYKDGIIPNELTAKLRVDNPYDVFVGTNEKKGYPTYRFTLTGQEAGALETPELVNKALDAINVVPNPYYAYSAYETSQFTNTVKISNLPAKCVVTIYSLDGKFIRQYRRDDVETSKGTTSGVPSRQINPDIEWDLKNNKSIPIASGTYIIHVSSDLGEKTLKWFGVMRPFDPSGL